jgi:hypothetical protein
MCSLALTENYAHDRRGFRGRRVDLSRALPAVCLEVNPASGVESEHVVPFLFTHVVHAVVHSYEKNFWHMGTGTHLFSCSPLCSFHPIEYIHWALVYGTRATASVFTMSNVEPLTKEGFRKEVGSHICGRGSEVHSILPLLAFELIGRG